MENPVKLSISYRAYDRKGHDEKPPGRPVGVISVKPKGHIEGRFNPLTLFFTVSPYRKDLNQVIDQMEQQKNARLRGYAKDLFYSCFKNW